MALAVELRVERERQAMDRKTNQHRIKRWNSAAKEKSRMQGITRAAWDGQGKPLVALTSKLEEMPKRRVFEAKRTAYVETPG